MYLVSEYYPIQFLISKRKELDLLNISCNSYGMRILVSESNSCHILVTTSKPFLSNAFTNQNIGFTQPSISSQQNDVRCGGRGKPLECPLHYLPTQERQIRMDKMWVIWKRSSTPWFCTISKICLDLLPQ